MGGLVDPGPDQLTVVTDSFGPAIDIHPLVMEDLEDSHRRPKLDRYEDHVFMDLFEVRIVSPARGSVVGIEDSVAGASSPTADQRGVRIELPGSNTVEFGTVSAVVFADRVITIRSEDCGFDPQTLVYEWEQAGSARRSGVGLVIHALVDYVVDQAVDAAEFLNWQVDELEQQVIDASQKLSDVQPIVFTMRKALAMLRRIVAPTRALVSMLLRSDGTGFLAQHTSEAQLPYLHDVYDHILRVSETLEALREELTSVLELTMTMQSNELNEVMKKLTAWAAIIAVPTAITGYFGQNLPYPGFSQPWGYWQSLALIVFGGLFLWFRFRKLNWL